MAKVLDSSALLAAIQGERGGDKVFAQIHDCVIGSVNAGEVMRVSMSKGVAAADVRRVFFRFQLSVIPFDFEDAAVAAKIGAAVRHLSFGDCACIALARRVLGHEVLTGDKIWAESELGVKVTLIR